MILVGLYFFCRTTQPGIFYINMLTLLSIDGVKYLDANSHSKIFRWYNWG